MFGISSGDRFLWGIEGEELFITSLKGNLKLWEKTSMRK